MTKPDVDQQLDALTFAEFRKANVERCADVFPPLEAWSPTDWGCALAGEVGEACNLLKKMLLGATVPIEDVAAELADVQTYLDLLAARLRIDLGAATRAKFNRVSERRGSKIKLPSFVSR